MAPNERPEPLLSPHGDKIYQQPYRSRMWVWLWQRMFFGFIWEDISEQNTKRQ